MRTLFISDLHLSEAAPAALGLFESFLAGEARGADALYILGDLFEFWVGDDDPDPAAARVCAALQLLTASGVSCFVMHGNRDFLLGAEFERRTGCVLLPDPTLLRLAGKQILLTHGDAFCTGDHAYQALRANVRRADWQRRALRLPLTTRLALAGGARAGSRAHTSTAADYIMDVEPESVQAALGACAADVLVHGHTHRPGIHTYTLADGRNAQRIVLGAWHESGSLLRWGEAGPELVTLPFD